MNEFNSKGRHTDKKYEKDTQIKKEREQKDRQIKLDKEEREIERERKKIKR